MSNSTFSALLSGVRFGKFASVGAVGAVFDVTTTTVLMFFFDVLNEYAKLVGAEVAIVVMFVINENWTFAGEGASGALPTLRRFLTSNLVRSGGLAVQFLVVRAFREAGLTFFVLGVDVWELLPIPLAIGASMLLNYVAESLFTWRITRG